MLYIVSTPIGNLADLTYRAAQTLNICHIIAAEDTRRTRILLDSVEIIPKKIVSYNENNERTRIPQLIKYMLNKKNIALVTDEKAGRWYWLNGR